MEKIICHPVSLLLKRAASTRLAGELGVGVCVRAKSREPTAAQVCIKDSQRMGHQKGRLRPEEKGNSGKDVVSLAGAEVTSAERKSRQSQVVKLLI